MFGGGVRVCRRSTASLRLLFLAAPAMWKRRHCRGIISPGFFRSPVAIYSDANGEAGETCVGVQGWHIVVFRMRWGGYHTRSSNRQIVPEKFKVRGVSSRCSFSQVYDAIQGFSDRKKQLVQETGFGGLLSFPPLWQIDRMFVVWLMCRVDALEHCIVIDNHRKVKFGKEDVGHVFGIPSCGRTVLVNPRPKRELVSRVWCDLVGFKDSRERSTKSLLEVVNRDYGSQMSPSQCVEFKIAFVIYVMSTVLAPGSTYNHVYLDYAEALLDHNEIRYYDWSGFVFRKLIDAITYMKIGLRSKKKVVNITGCSLFLQVIYLDSIDLGVWSMAHTTFPRIKEFSADRLRYMIRADTLQQSEDCTDRIFGTKELLPRGQVCYSWARGGDRSMTVCRQESNHCFVDATLSLARLFNIDFQDASPLCDALAGIDMGSAAKTVSAVVSFLQPYARSAGLCEEVGTSRQSEGPVVPVLDTGETSGIERVDAIVGDSVLRTQNCFGREDLVQVNGCDNRLSTASCEDLKDPWELGFNFSYSREAAGVMLSQICSLYCNNQVSPVFGLWQRHGGRMLSEMEGNIFGDEELGASLVDAVLRSVKIRDASMYRAYGGARWRHYVTSGFMESLLRGNFDSNGCTAFFNFDPSSVGYDVCLCKMVFFPALLDGRWVCYAWKPLLDQWFVYDPVGLQCETTQGSSFHCRTVEHLRDALMEVQCLTWSVCVDTSEKPCVQMISYDDRFGRCNRSGVACLYFCTMFDGVSFRGDVSMPHIGSRERVTIGEALDAFRSFQGC